MGNSTWRAVSQRIIAKVEAEHKGSTYQEFRAALHNAYPFGQRSHHPYKIWCDEQRKALARHCHAPQEVKHEDDLFNYMDASDG